MSIARRYSPKDITVPAGIFRCFASLRSSPEPNFAWSRWLNNEATLGELRAAQDEAVASD